MSVLHPEYPLFLQDSQLLFYILDNTAHEDLLMFATFLHFAHISTSS